MKKLQQSILMLIKRVLCISLLFDPIIFATQKQLTTPKDAVNINNVNAVDDNDDEIKDDVCVTELTKDTEVKVESTEKVCVKEKIVPAASGLIVKQDLGFSWAVSGMFKPEMFYGRNISLLNNKNETDKIWYARHTLDFNFDLNYGRKIYDHDILKLYFTLRNKSIWGNPNSIVSTTDTDVGFLSSVGKSHRHSVPRHFLWIRELWMRIELMDMLGLGFENDHTITLGSFPFELGRGIALGDNYATAPELLGYYTEANVDQFAYGAKLSGDIIHRRLAYDFYVAILNNKASGLGDTAEKIRGQEFGKLRRPGRGFGVINYVVAARLNWDVFDNRRFGRLHLEPYAMYNNDPEQRVEFLGDANSRLGTVGLACEYKGERFEFGFDWAQNLGRQYVKGVDRNQIKLENRNGFAVEVNSDVLVDSPTGKKLLFVANSPAQKLVTQSRADELIDADKKVQNGKSIGQTTIDGQTVTLYNSDKRFRDPYTNIYQGWMFVTDASLWLYKKDLQMALTAGVASGDDNPNNETIDGNYTGFISLQEFYSGKRVKSVFLMGGAGRLRRPLSVPDPLESINTFAGVVSGFTNLVFCGWGLNYKPQNVEKQLKINPNVLAYWQQRETRKFSVFTQAETKEFARNFLGIEANLFFDYFVLRDLKLYVVTSAFFPGTHYHDIRGKPLNPDQAAALSTLDLTGFTNADVPNIGTDVSYTFNLGIEYKF